VALERSRPIENDIRPETSLSHAMRGSPRILLEASLRRGIARCSENRLRRRAVPAVVSGNAGLKYVGVEFPKKTRCCSNWLQPLVGTDMLCDTAFMRFGMQSFDAIYCAAVNGNISHHAAGGAGDLPECSKGPGGGYYLGNCSLIRGRMTTAFITLEAAGLCGRVLTYGG